MTTHGNRDASDGTGESGQMGSDVIDGRTRPARKKVRGDRRGTDEENVLGRSVRSTGCACWHCSHGGRERDGSGCGCGSGAGARMSGHARTWTWTCCGGSRW